VKDLRFDSESFGIEEKWGFEIWINDPVLERCEI